jgi:hypothetical protein
VRRKTYGRYATLERAHRPIWPFPLPSLLVLLFLLYRRRRYQHHNPPRFPPPCPRVPIHQSIDSRLPRALHPDFLLLSTRFFGCPATDSARRTGAQDTLSARRGERGRRDRRRRNGSSERGGRGVEVGKGGEVVVIFCFESSLSSRGWS